MDPEEGNLIKIPDTKEDQQTVTTDNIQHHPQKTQQTNEKPDADAPIDVIKELIQNKNSLPLLAVVDQVDLFSKTQDGVPLFNLLMNKFLPLQQLLGQGKIKFETDGDGRTPLHYAVQVDDAKAVYWLLSKGARNVADKFGNTPVMDAVRLGHRRSFLLCIHYQHVNQTLPHIAAEYNRVWQLKAMQALSLRIDVGNDKFKTPLEIAVQNYSYEAAEYLAFVTDNYEISQLKQLTDSAALMGKIKKSKKKSSSLQRAVVPFVVKLFIFLFLVFNVLFNEIYTISQYIGILNLITYFFLFSMIFVFNWLFKTKRKDPESILTLLRQPDFPSDLDHICPACFNIYNPQTEDHCDMCHCCVNKFHQHRYVCINKSNQIAWYITQYFCLFMLYVLLRDGIYYCNTHIVEKGSQGFLYDFVRAVYFAIYVKERYYLGAYFIFLFGIFVQQILFCLQLFGMAFMNKTYQQVTHSEDYPHLYTVFKSKAGKLKTKQYRLFYEYKLLGGLVMGIKNIVFYFL